MALGEALSDALMLGTVELPKLLLADGHGGHGLAEAEYVGARLGLGLSEPLGKRPLDDADALKLGEGLIDGHGSQLADGDGEADADG